MRKSDHRFGAYTVVDMVNTSAPRSFPDFGRSVINVPLVVKAHWLNLIVCPATVSTAPHLGG